MPAPYKGKFTTLENVSKYVGNPENIIYRSLWERNAFKWCDENPSVEEWASEEIVIPYDNPVTGKRSKYYPDIFLKMSDGRIRIIEIKPKSQTVKPEQPSRKSTKYVEAVATYMINQEKWKAASELAKKNGMSFEIWTEDTLKEMGILNANQDKLVLKEESTNSKKPKMKSLKRAKPKKPVSRPKRKS